MQKDFKGIQAILEVLGEGIRYLDVENTHKGVKRHIFDYYCQNSNIKILLRTTLPQMTIIKK